MKFAMIALKRRGRPKQDPKSRRAEILAEAIKAFSKDGYRKTDMQTLADELGIAKETRRSWPIYSAALSTPIFMAEKRGGPPSRLMLLPSFCLRAF